jgi:hypothetical protein
MSYYLKSGNYMHNIAQEDTNRKYRLIDNVAYEKGLLDGAAFMANKIVSVLTIERII